MKQRTRDIIKVCLGILLAAPVFFCCSGLAKPKGSWRFSPSSVSAWAVASLAMVQEICSACAP